MRDRKNERKKRLPLPLRMLLGLLLTAMVLAGLGLGVLCFAEGIDQKNTELSAGDAIIVLGSQVYADGSLSPNLTFRVQKALEAWQLRPRTVVVCGGQGGDEPVPEGDAMKAWLTERGVPEEMILVDNTSGDTRQNMKNAMALLNGEATEVLIVTSDFHLPRALSVAAYFGFRPRGAAAETKPEYWVKNHTREVLAWVKWGLYAGLGWDVPLH